MSKGSNRRPGEGYADNWEKIYGKPSISKIEISDISEEIVTSISNLVDKYKDEQSQA